MRRALAALALALLAALAAPAAELKGRLLPEKGKGDFEGFVAWLEEGPGVVPQDCSGRVHVMNQIDREFSPRVLAVRRGDSVNFENLDNVFHNVFSLDKRSPFDLGLYKGKKHFAPDMKTELVEAAGTAVAFSTPGKFHVFCNIHPEMTGSVYVFDHPYYSLLERNGLFSLSAPGEGTFTLALDGPRLSEPFKTSVKLPQEAPLIEVRLRVSRRPAKVPHTRKDGRRYPSSEPQY